MKGRIGRVVPVLPFLQNSSVFSCYNIPTWKTVDCQTQTTYVRGMFMKIGAGEVASEEEALVAELELLGIRYLSRQTSYQAMWVRPPARLLVDLAQQQNARVREALIAVFLACPRYAHAVPASVAELDATDPSAAANLRLLYTAAAFLQQKHRERLESFLGVKWLWLPDLFSADLGLPRSQMPADDKLALLGQAHREATGVLANWSGTYDNVAHKLIRRWEMEQVWSRSQ